jgi:hypothetical protein
MRFGYIARKEDDSVQFATGVPDFTCGKNQPHAVEKNGSVLAQIPP